MTSFIEIDVYSDSNCYIGSEFKINLNITSIDYFAQIYNYMGHEVIQLKVGKDIWFLKTDINNFKRLLKDMYFNDKFKNMVNNE